MAPAEPWFVGEVGMVPTRYVHARASNLRAQQCSAVTVCIFRGPGSVVGRVQRLGVRAYAVEPYCSSSNGGSYLDVLGHL